jgi:hypothetical protein
MRSRHLCLVFANLPGVPGKIRLRQLLRELFPGNAFRPTTGG